ncbi:GNAT family N-acetyltransferase [Enterococcus sp. LJL51]|uniref:GNAT family N-acetyltransferase n=1 Tax=Enterococcus sp. LJL51 TaxID=3416656 RepID=UPI003CF6402C
MFQSFKETPSAVRTELWNQGFSDYLVPVKVTEQQLNDRLSFLKLKDDWSWIYLSDGKPAGIILYGEAVWGQEKVGWIGGLAVHPEYRSKNIAKLLMNQAETIAKQHSVSRMTLEVITENTKAVELYKKLGYYIASKVLVLKRKVTEKPQSKLSFSKIAAEQIVEPDNTPWQNWLSHGNEGYKISSEENKRIGTIVLSRNEQQVTICQMNLVDFNKDGENMIRNLAEAFGREQVVGMNFSESSQETKQLLNIGFSPIVEQYQMEKNYNTDELE